MPTARTSKRMSKHPRRARAHRPRHLGISRTKLQTVRDNLSDTTVALDDTLDRFWLVPESDVRATLAHTKKQIDKAVTLLSRAA